MYIFTELKSHTLLDKWDLREAAQFVFYVAASMHGDS